MECRADLYDCSNCTSGNRCIGDGKRRILCSFVFGYRRKLCGGIQKWKKDKVAVVLGIFMLILTVGIGGWISRKLVLDLIEGPKIVHLTSITMKESFGLSGIISHHYYLCGRDDNDKWKGYQMEVSADEYYELEGKQQVTVLCYPRTERILKIL